MQILQLTRKVEPSAPELLESSVEVIFESYTAHDGVITVKIVVRQPSLTRFGGHPLEGPADGAMNTYGILTMPPQGVRVEHDEWLRPRKSCNASASACGPLSHARGDELDCQLRLQVTNCVQQRLHLLLPDLSAVGVACMKDGYSMAIFVTKPVWWPMTVEFKSGGTLRISRYAEGFAMASHYMTEAPQIQSGRAGSMGAVASSVNEVTMPTTAPQRPIEVGMAHGTCIDDQAVGEDDFVEADIIGSEAVQVGVPRDASFQEETT
ncbi:uncharacterized protein BO95DRAFT_434792 [Aspergillus brunneoviolaceus CBS 621.78]|uniref:Uncharacterized protein n=1 Tax=Aspergillus brunneoviolaceus CBS 621.78 TaxID=1450534 RepID=A0ACD1FZV8_9EURO|nr:hypothetical protein BO95DRAFT_434792 [Aspergillus brunneoviolaceus CBS 621.78]RAH42487.1 hypothetical protein BO95DRAFT_434792 [Aspergillus brunneoviolaceus CBS 621.78]